MTNQQGTPSKVNNPGIVIAVLAILFAVSPSRSYGQGVGVLDCGLSCNLGGTAGDNGGTATLYIAPLDPGQTSLAVGQGVMLNDTADFNTGVGMLALNANTSGEFNTATGDSALEFNTTGPHNTADGTTALVFNTTGGDNTAMGYAALATNTTSGGSTAVGFQALNLSTGATNTAIGSGACLKVTSASDVTCLGPIAGANISKSTYVAFVYKTTVGTTNAEVCIDNTGKLGTVGCPTTAAIAEHTDAIKQQQETIRIQAQQIAELQQRLSQLEALMAKK